MALLHRRKAFSVISRYRLCGHSHYSFLSSGSASSARSIAGLSSPSSSTQMLSLRHLLPATAVAMQSLSSRNFRSYTAVATSLGSKQATPCCYTHKCTSECGCICTRSGGLASHILARNCTTTAYPPPAPPEEYQGGDEEAEADGAPLDIEEAVGAPPMGGPNDFNMPPYDDSNYPEEDEGDYEDEDPPPDPEEKLLFSPSDED